MKKLTTNNLYKFEMPKSKKKLTEKETIEFLKNKLSTAKIGWGTIGEVSIRSGHGNINMIGKNVISFIEYNELPLDGRTFDGHYEFYINYKTFKYIIRQNSYYGSLTWTTPPKEEGWKKLNETDKKYAEALIAHKLLGAYFYDHNAVNQNGKNLFSTGEKEPAGHGFNKNIVWWNDGAKRSLISEPIGELDEFEKQALEILGTKSLAKEERAI